MSNTKRQAISTVGRRVRIIDNANRAVRDFSVSAIVGNASNVSSRPSPEFSVNYETDECSIKFDIPLKSCVLRVKSPGLTPSVVDCPLESDWNSVPELIIKLQRPGQVVGIVARNGKFNREISIDLKHGLHFMDMKSIENAEARSAFELIRENQDFILNNSKVYVGPDGKFQLSSAPPGIWIVQISGVEIAESTFEIFIRSGNVTDLGMLNIEPSATVKTHITKGKESLSQSGIDVVLQAIASKDEIPKFLLRRGTTDMFGDVVFEHIPTGDYLVSIEREKPAIDRFPGRPLLLQKSNDIQRVSVTVPGETKSVTINMNE